MNSISGPAQNFTYSSSWNIYQCILCKSCWLMTAIISTTNFVSQCLPNYLLSFNNCNLLPFLSIALSLIEVGLLQVNCALAFVEALCDKSAHI